jgi:hypothetical protein
MYDRQGMPLSSYYKGVTARKSDLEVNAIFDRVCEVTDPKDSKISLVISCDITGWSPQGDRAAWSKHHDYVVHTTKAPKYLKLETIWRNMYACMSKRGLVARHELTKGLFQGRTATLDSLIGEKDRDRVISNCMEEVDNPIPVIVNGEIVSKICERVTPLIGL